MGRRQRRCRFAPRVFDKVKPGVSEYFTAGFAVRIIRIDMQHNVGCRVHAYFSSLTSLDHLPYHGSANLPGDIRRPAPGSIAYGPRTFVWLYDGSDWFKPPLSSDEPVRHGD